MKGLILHALQEAHILWSLCVLPPQWAAKSMSYTLLNVSHFVANPFSMPVLSQHLVLCNF